MVEADRTVWARVLRSVWPKSAIGRALWVSVPVAVLVVILAPVAALASAVMGIAQGVVTPVFASPGGRLLALNLLVVAAVLVASRGLRRRWVAVRSGVRLRQLVDALEAIAEGREADARVMLSRARKSNAAWPGTLPGADAHLACALARLELGRGEPGAALRVLDGISIASVPADLRLVIHHLECAALRALDEVLPAERSRRIDAALVEFPDDPELLRARRAIEHETRDSDAAADTQRRIVELVGPADRAEELARLAADLELSAGRALRDGRLDAARKAAEECARLGPEDPDALLLLGDALAATGHLTGALEAWARVADERALVRAFQELGSRPDAVRSEDLLRVFPLDGALLLVAHLEESQGRAGRASRARRIALRLRPEWSQVAGVPELALGLSPR